MLVIIAVIVSFVIALLGYVYSKFARTLELAKQFDGPKAWPIIGHAHYLVGREPHVFVELFFEITEKYPGCSKVWIGPEFNLFLSDLDLVEKVLSSTKLIDKSDQYRYLKPWLRDGLLISKGSKWSKRRKIITPAFHFQILEQFIDVFEKQGDIMIESLLDYKPGSIIELYQWVSLCALDIICVSAMGVTANAQKDSGSEYVNAVRTISKVLHKRMFDVLYRFDFLFNLTPLARQQQKALKIIHDFSERVILSRREELLKMNNNKFWENENDIGQKKRKAFLDILLQSEIDGKPLSNLDIREEVDTFMFEGHDTVTSAITFCLYNLSKYPEVQEKAFQEVLSVFGSDKNKQATYDDLCNLRYLELVAKESLRLFPSVPLLGRKVIEEYTINGKIIPAGTNIGISPLMLGRMESIFPDAEKFIPERFDVIKCAEKMNPFAFVPFSAGPRNCIGQKFAMFELKSVISKILRNFTIEYVPQGEPVLIAELILKSKDSIKFRLSPRVY